MSAVTYFGVGGANFHLRDRKFQNLWCFWTELSTTVGEKTGVSFSLFIWLMRVGDSEQKLTSF